DPAPPFAWTSGEIHVDVVLGVGLLAAAYARAWTRGPRGGLREPALFLAALLVLLVALNGPLHDLSDYYLFSAHMVQHLLLTLVVPPLLLAGTPGWIADALLGRLRRRLHYGTQILYLFAFGIPMTVVAAMITGAEQTLYPFYAAAPRLFGLEALADQRLGGLIMWVPAGLVPLLAFTVVFFRWVAA